MRHSDTSHFSCFNFNRFYLILIFLSLKQSASDCQKNILFLIQINLSINNNYMVMISIFCILSCFSFHFLLFFFSLSIKPFFTFFNKFVFFFLTYVFASISLTFFYSFFVFCSLYSLALCSTMSLYLIYCGEFCVNSTIYN